MATQLYVLLSSTGDKLVSKSVTVATPGPWHTNIPAIDLYHSAAIFVNFPVYPVVNSTNFHNTEKVPDYLPFQPRFGYTALNGRKRRWLHHDKGLYQS